jgi:hypothetical protein
VYAYSESHFKSRGFLAVFGQNFNKFDEIEIIDKLNGHSIEYFSHDNGIDKSPYDSSSWEETEVDENTTEYRYYIDFNDFNNSDYKRSN